MTVHVPVHGFVNVHVLCTYILYIQHPGSEEVSNLVLEVNIPMLDDGVPEDWKVSLVDNPGFGEAKECITELADASMVTSSAYIYLVQTENVGGKEAAAFFMELDKLDKGEEVL